MALARDSQLGENIHRYANRIGATMCIPTDDRDAHAVGRRPYQLRRGGYRSIRQGLRELADDIEGMFALGEVATAGAKT